MGGFRLGRDFLQRQSWARRRRCPTDTSHGRRIDSETRARRGGLQRRRTPVQGRAGPAQTPVEGRVGSLSAKRGCRSTLFTCERLISRVIEKFSRVKIKNILTKRATRQRCVFLFGNVVASFSNQKGPLLQGTNSRAVEANHACLRIRCHNLNKHRPPPALNA